MAQGGCDSPGVVNISASGNMAFEVGFGDQKSPAVARSPLTPLRAGLLRTTPSLREIEDKLEAAEKRRATFEQEKVNKAQVEEQKLAEAARRRVESEQEFRASVEAELLARLHSSQENRERVIGAVMERLKEHEERVAAVQKSAGEERIKKLRLSNVLDDCDMDEQSALRHKHVDQLVDTLKQEDARVEAVRGDMKRHMETEQLKWQARLQAAQKRRDTYLQAIQEKQSEHSQHVKAVLLARKEDQNNFP